MCVPEGILGRITIWNDECFWVFKMKKREVASIVWYLGKCFVGFRILGKSVFLNVNNDVRSGRHFMSDDILKRRNFLGFEILEKRGYHYCLIFRNVIGRFRNHCCHLFFVVQTMCVSIMTFWRTDNLKRWNFLGFEILEKRGSLYSIRFLCINKVFNVFRWIFHYWFRYQYIQYNFINGASLRAHKEAVYQTTT